MARLARGANAWVLGLWLAALAVCGGVIAHTRFTADMSAFLPASPNPEQRLLVEQIRSGLPARTVLLGIVGGTAEQRAQASRGLARALRASGLFEQVQNGERDTWQDVGAWLVAHRYGLSPAVTPSRFTVDGLRNAIDDTLALLGTPEGAGIKPLLSRDPTGETRRIAESLIPAEAPRSEQGVWVSRQASRAVLLLGTRAAGSDLDAQAIALTRIQAEFKALALPGLRLQWSGGPVFAVASRARIEREVRYLSAAGGVAMGLLLWLSFASLRALVVAALPVAAGVLAGIAAVSLAFGSVHGMTLGFGSTMIGEAVDYAIYYLIQARAGAVAGDPPGQGWQRWRRGSWPTVRLGLLTSLCGFAALTFSDFPGLAQLGVFSMSGLVAAALTARFVLPRLMPDGAPGGGLRARLARASGRALASLPKARGLALVLSAAALAYLWWSPAPLWRGDLASLSPVPAAAMALDAQLRADLSASDGGSLVLVHGADAEAALQGAEAVAARLDRWVDAGRLGGYDTPSRWLPSQATQAARRDSLPTRQVLAERLAEAARSSPLAASSLGPFLDDVARQRQAPLLTRADLQDTPLAPLVNGLLLADPRAGGVTALLPLYPASGHPLDEPALRRLVQDVPGAQVLDLRRQLDDLYARYLSSARIQALLGALAVVALLALWLRSWRRVLAVCLPLLLAVILCLGALAVMQVALGVLHLVGLLLVVAVGSNYALFFDNARSGPPDDDTLASLMLANLTTVTSFGLIACSGIPALSAIGRVVAPGALLSLWLAAAFVGSRSGHSAV